MKVEESAGKRSHERALDQRAAVCREQVRLQAFDVSHVRRFVDVALGNEQRLRAVACEVVERGKEVLLAALAGRDVDDLQIGAIETRVNAGLKALLEALAVGAQHVNPRRQRDGLSHEGVSQLRAGEDDNPLHWSPIRCPARAAVARSTPHIRSSASAARFPAWPSNRLSCCRIIASRPSRCTSGSAT